MVKMKPEVMNLTKLHFETINSNDNNFSPIPLILSLIITLTLKAPAKPKCYPILFIFYAIVMIVTFPIIFVILALFWLYKKLICLIVFTKLRSKFGGMLSGHDTFWTLKDPSNPIIHILLYINYKSQENLLDAFLKAMKMKLTDAEEHKKLFAIISKCSGYPYLVKNQINVEDCIRIMPYDEYKDEESLRDNLQQFRYPKSGGLWEFSVGCEPLNWGERRNCFPVVVRFHHAIGDGFALLQMLLNFFEEREVQDVCDEDDSTFVQNMIKISIRCMHFCVLLYNLPLVMARRVFHKNDVNCIHGGDISGEKEVVWKNEVNAKYVKIVKELKKRLPGTSFFDIVSSAISNSITRLHEKKQDKPNMFSCVIPAVPNALQFSSLKKSRNISLENRFAVGVLDLPSEAFDSCKDRLEYVKKWTFQLKTSYEFQINSWTLDAIGLLPECIVAPIIQSAQSTMVISNLPGPSRINLFGDNVLQDIIFWIPHRGLTGVGISILSYDQRFSLGLSVDKSFNISRKEMQSILDDIFGYLDELYTESSSI